MLDLIKSDVTPAIGSPQKQNVLSSPIGWFEPVVMMQWVQSSEMTLLLGVFLLVRDGNIDSDKKGHR